MNSSSSDPAVWSILDFPDEILVKILLRINARKRSALAHSCKRFHSLVFGDEDLLRDLDFSKNGRLTTPTHIYPYFGDEERRKHVRRVNFQNVLCMDVKMLNDTIGKARNLVEVNILGITFKDMEAISRLLRPLVQIRRLSLDWPYSKEKNAYAICKKVLRKRFSKLKYLSTEIHNSLGFFCLAVQLCAELEELRIFADVHFCDDNDWRIKFVLNPDKLKNLKIVQIHGRSATGCLLDPVISVLPDRHKWTLFQPIDYVAADAGYYFEKDVEVCEQLRNSECVIECVQSITRFVRPGLTALEKKTLMQEIIKITHKDVPETTFCSLGTEYSDSFSMEIDDLRQLLKNPGHRFSYLHIRHCIEYDCDAHLFVSAFKDLRELIISGIKKKDVSAPTKRKNFARRLRRKDSSVAEEPDDPSNLDSSFQMLVENTPHVEELTIHSTCGCGREEWDLESLSLISKWRNLTALRLASIPLEDGKFLIDIGQQCPKLEILVLFSLARERVDCYTSDLSKMLIQCRNLREFSIFEHRIDNLTEIVASLSNNLKLRRFYVKIIGVMSATPELISSIEDLLRTCVKLNTFVCRINGFSKICFEDQLALALRRIKNELNRPKFQFQLCGKYNFDPQIEKVHEDASTSFFPRQFDWDFS